MDILFPQGFVWGAATASYQIEGGVDQDGRGPSIWDTFSHTPGKVHNGDTGDIACDFYNRYNDDIDLMADLGLQAFRFSVAWPRILPEGTGAVNAAGLDYYERVVDALLARNIEPYLTLYHWDLPQALQDKGGWPERMIVDAFANYADIVSRRLGDRVKYWMTHNEPFVAAFVGYAQGRHAPGIQDVGQALAASHHLLLSHGRAVEVLRRNCRPDAQVGIVLDLQWVEPATGTAADIEAARRFDGFHNRWFLDPVFKGRYPADMLELYGGLPVLAAGDLDIIRQPVDFLGVNTYFRQVIAASAENPPLNTTQVHPEGDYTAMGWEIHPDSFYKLLARLRADYAPPALYITENGAAFEDIVAPDGGVHDTRRVDYLRGHLASVQRAIGDGVPVKGYFVWSFMDNFEWALGYSKRFGVVYVDYATQQRIPKDSALWYRDTIRHNGFEA